MEFTKESILKAACADKDIQTLVKEYKIDQTKIENDYLTLASYLVKKNSCAACKKLSDCSQGMKGLKPVICYNGMFYIEYLPCEKKEEQDIIERSSNNLITFACNLDNIDSTKLFKISARKEIYSRMKIIYDSYTNDFSPKGLYIHGPYGTGKSYTMGCFAKKFAGMGYKVVFAYYPDLVRQFKNAINNGTLETIIKGLKSVDILFLDDFGGETSSAFIRDEVLSPILQERMENHLLTFMTSNLDEKRLHEHLAETSKDIDELKASRVEERIKTLMDFVSLEDKNYRE